MISHVINYDIPDTVDAYIHRIGRTGRALRSGKAFTLVTLEDRDTVLAIERALGERLPTQFLEGFNYQQAGAQVEEKPQRRSDNRPRGTQRAKLPSSKPLASTANHRQPSTTTRRSMDSSLRPATTPRHQSSHRRMKTQ
jgi:ATP-dependent RNA helicase RhlE